MSSAVLCTVPAAQLLFEAVFREAFSFQHHLTGFLCINVSLGAKGTGGGGGEEAAWAPFTVNTLTPKKL
jgi:hypothetical protein